MESIEPVVVLWKHKYDAFDECYECYKCQQRLSIWDAIDDVETATSAMKKIYPNIRIVVISVVHPFDEATVPIVPKGMIFYQCWYPMIILVPGKIWNNAMTNRGSDADVRLQDWVQILNGYWHDDFKCSFIYKYDTLKPSEYGRWLKDAMENEEFRKVQYW